MAEDNTAETANQEQSTNYEADASSDLDGLNDEITSMRVHIAKLNEENKKHRLRAKDEQEAKIDALQQNGEFKEADSRGAPIHKDSNPIRSSKCSKQ